MLVLLKRDLTLWQRSGLLGALSTKPLVFRHKQSAQPPHGENPTANYEDLPWTLKSKTLRQDIHLGILVRAVRITSTERLQNQEKPGL